MKPTLRWILFVSGLSVCFPTGGRLDLLAQNAPNATLANNNNAVPERQVTIPADLPGTPPRVVRWINPTDLASLQNVLTSASLLNNSNPRKYEISPFNNPMTQGPSAVLASTEIVPVMTVFSQTGSGIASDALAVRLEDKATPPVPEANENAPLASGNSQFSAVTLNDGITELSDQEDLENAGISGPFEQAFKIFPNPAREYVLVRIIKQLNAPFQVLVMSDNGTCMQELRCSQGKAGDEWFVNTEDLLPGVYFFRINNGTSVLVRKVFIL